MEETAQMDNLSGTTSNYNEEKENRNDSNEDDKSSDSKQERLKKLQRRIQMRVEFVKWTML